MRKIPILLFAVLLLVSLSYSRGFGGIGGLTGMGRFSVTSFSADPTNPNPGQTVTFTFTASNPSGALGTAFLMIEGNSQSVASTNSCRTKSVCTASFTTTQNIPGTYRYYVVVSDARGKKSASSEKLPITFQNSITINSFSAAPASITAGEEITFSFSVSSTAATITTITLEKEDSGAIKSTAICKGQRSCTNSIRYKEDSFGVSNYRIVVYDKNRNSAASNWFTVDVKPKPEDKSVFATIEKTAAASPFEIVRDWRIISILVAMITIVLVSLAIMLGKSFEMPEVVAWGTTELQQIITTVLIILFLAGMLTFLDSTLAQVVNGSNLPRPAAEGGGTLQCRITDNCAILTADAYLEDMIQNTKDSVGEVLDNAQEVSNRGSTRAGGFAIPQFLPVPLLQATYSSSTEAGYMMYLDRYTVVLEHFTTVISSLVSQKYFVESIAFKIGPVIFVLGIVGRSFFLTRRLGGLLMATGIGVMYVFPFMYVFDWWTLNITIFGDSILVPEAASCPQECKLLSPIIYTNENPPRTFSTIAEATAAFGEIPSSPPPPGGLGGAFPERPTATQLINLETGKLKTLRLRAITLNSCNASAVTPYGYCPNECRERPYPLTPTCTIVNESDDVEKACNYIPRECTVIRYVDISTASDYEPKFDSMCPSECRTVPPLKINCDNNAGDAGSCLDSRFYCRAAPAEDLGKRPADCDDIGEARDNAQLCIADTNAEANCVYIIPETERIDANSCKECLFVPQSYTYKPAVRVNCAQLCNKAGGPPKISPLEFARRTREGMYGPAEIKNIASLVLPAYILPLLNIVVTLMFIRSFSVMLGGDIEIPGVSKLI